MLLDFEYLPHFPGGSSQRKTPLGTPGSRCYSPSVVQTPPPIKEEEPITTPPQQTDVQNGTKVQLVLIIIQHIFVFMNSTYFPPDYWQVEKNNSLRHEYDVITTPPAAQSTRVQSTQPLNTPEANQRRDLLTQLTYDSPASGAPPAAAPGIIEWATIRLKWILMGHNVWQMFWSKAPAAAVVSGAEGRGAPLTAIQMSFVRNMIHEALEDFRWVTTYLSLESFRDHRLGKLNLK